MLNKRLIYTLILGMTAQYAVTASAQDSLLLRDYQYVKQQDTWLSLQNNAALTRFASSNIVEAEAVLTKGNGGWVDYYQSDNTLTGDVHIESLCRLNARTVFFGAIRYNNYTGRGMTGSAFIDPTRKPFNLVEDSLTNAGRKHRDTYQLAGGIGIDIYRGLSMGARIDYISANYAKYKDLRHKNKLMDLNVTAGIYAPVNPWLNIGADYQYHRNTESLEFSTYGKSEKVYKTLIDYGSMMGLVEQFGNEGYTDKTREMPLFEDAHGGSIQIEVVPMKALSVFGNLTFSHGTGYYGRLSPYTITLTNHKRDQLKTEAALTYRLTTSWHRLRFAYSYEKVKNNAETYRGLTNDNGATYYEYYDPAETGDKRWREIGVSYTAHLGINGELPTWTVTADYHWMQRRQQAYLFPYYRQQKTSNNEIAVSATRHITTAKGVWSLMLKGTYLKGSGAPFEDGTFLTPSAKQPQPATMEAFLWREYQYLTAAQYSVGAQVKYAFIFPGTRLKTHARISVDHRKGNETYDYSEGQRHTQLSAAIGCTF